MLAGFVKGVVGLGLPTVAIGLLSLIMAPAQAVVIMFVPTLVTNVWQLAIGPSLKPLFRRLWPMLALIFVGAIAGVGVLTAPSAWPSIALGAVLSLYALVGLFAVQFRTPRRLEWLLTPLVGLINGFVSAATGVMAVPAVPYLQSLGLNKDDLVQALGLLFTASMLALAVVLTRENAFSWSLALPSAAGLLTALAGMYAGQLVRERIDARVFRLCFFIGMLALGVHLVLSKLL